MEEHRVAVTVFCTAPGADAMDAAYGATLALRGVLGGEKGRLPNDVPLVTRHGAKTVRVVDVLEAGVAIRNGLPVGEPDRAGVAQRG